MGEPMHRLVGHMFRVGKEDVVITIHEYYDGENPVPTIEKVSSSNGLVTKTFEEMVELLDIPHPCRKPRAPLQPAEMDATESLPEATAVAPPSIEAAVLASADSHNGMDSIADMNAAGVTMGEPHVASSPECDGSENNLQKDADSYRELIRRQDEFAQKHPWLWGEYDDPKQTWTGTDKRMQMIWMAEELKVTDPELHAAALDPEKYRAYMEELGEKVRDDLPTVAADCAPRCEFVKLDGTTCGSPAMKKRRICCFHARTAQGRKKRKEIEVPVLEDDRAIQLTVTQICRALADGSLEGKRAATLLYGLQVASVAVRMKKAAR